jgi:hypothetical protein
MHSQRAFGAAATAAGRSCARNTGWRSQSDSGSRVGASGSSGPRSTPSCASTAPGSIQCRWCWNA